MLLYYNIFMSDNNIYKNLFIMGNGSSLKEIMDNPIYLKILKENDTFGLNMAYRAYETYNFWPTYFGCFDYIINESQKNDFENLVLSNNPIKQFYFVGDKQNKQNFFNNEVKSNKRFIKINFLNNQPKDFYKISDNFNNFMNAGCSGANATQIGIMLGYKNIFLLGCDAKYIYINNEAKVDNQNNNIIIVNQIKNNLNYWFDDYQRVNDKFNIPNTKLLHIPAWFNINQHCPKGVNIINCSLMSNISCFLKIPFQIIVKYLYKKSNIISFGDIFLNNNKLYILLNENNDTKVINNNDKVCVFEYYKQKITVNDKNILSYSPKKITYFNYICHNKKIILKYNDMYLDLNNFQLSKNVVENDFYLICNEQKYFDFVKKKLNLQNFNNFNLKFYESNNISVIGPAEHVPNLKKEKLYNNSIVARCNTGINAVGKENLGKYLNIYFHCVSTNKENGGEFDINKLIKYKCTDIVFTYPPLDANSDSTFNSISTIRDYIRLLDIDFKNINLWYFDQIEYIKLEKDLKCRPNTGFIMIFLMIEKFYSKYNINIDGFTFFETNYLNEIRGAIDGNIVPDNKVLALKRMEEAGWHKQLNQKQYLKKMIEDKQNVIVDDILKNILDKV